MSLPENRESLQNTSATLRKHRVLVLGDVSAAEMQPVLCNVIAVFAGSEIRVHPFQTGFFQRGEETEWIPELIVVCQCESDEFTRDDVLGLIAHYPLSRLVCCFGEWCESDGRTRGIWPIAVRIPARLAAMRLRREHEVLSGTKAALPLTAGREETFDFDAASPPATPARSSRHATVHSPDRELRFCFEDRLRLLGFTVRPGETDSAQNVILYDADPWCNVTRKKLRRLRDANPLATMVALMNFSRPEDVHAVTRSDANAVLPKLASLEQLAAAVTRPSNRDAAETVPCGVRGRGNL